MESNEGEVLTGAELFYYLTKENREKLERCRRKLSEYTQLEGILQCITDRCQVPILAPVASGAAYFEATIDYTNNILVLLGDNWFTERSAKQAREIVGRRLEFLRGEEVALVAEERALAERQELFLSEVPSAEKAMAEVEAAKQAALGGSRTGQLTTVTKSSQEEAGSGVTNPSPAIVGEPLMGSSLKPAGDSAEALLGGPELRSDEMTIFDEFDELTEDELLEIERELGDRVDDDELAERLMTERLIAKKEKRVREQLERQRKTTVGSSTVDGDGTEDGGETYRQQTDAYGTMPESSPAAKFVCPGDIGRVAAVVVGESKPGDDASHGEEKSRNPRRQVKFSETVTVVPPEGPESLVRRGVSPRVFGEVVEHKVAPPLDPITAVVTALSTKKKSVFRTEMECAARRDVDS